MRRTASLALLLLLALPAVAIAEPLQWHGYLDLRATTTDSEPNWMDGGYGKLRWGGADSPAQLGGAALVLQAPFAAAWYAQGTVQAQADDSSGLELLEAWVRWRPVATGRWRNSLKAGLFFPPVSLENDGPGWTNPYFVTSSALDTWIGEELRSTGIEWRAERRGDVDTFEFALTAFGGNDTAGELLADRGWALSDRVYGVFGSIRVPDPASFDGPPPRRFDPFVEIDKRIGVSAEVTWRRPGLDRLTLVRYDNRADPSVETHYDDHDVYAWRTRFTALGWERRGTDSVWLAQAMAGDTLIMPSPFFHSRTDFWAAYVAWARTSGDWRPAVRIDAFGADQSPDFTIADSEHGHALTVALAWQPQDAWRLTGELIAVHSVRGDRVLVGRDERQDDVQVQVSWRWFF
jgi:hypothetical protein